MWDERAALVEAIAANFADDTPRLVLADWLDEHGEADRAEFIRLQCEASALTPRCSTDDKRLSEIKARVHALFRNRWRDWVAPLCDALGAPRDPAPDRAPSWFQRALQRVMHPVGGSGRRRGSVECDVDRAYLQWNDRSPVTYLSYDRGFVTSLAVQLNSNRRAINAASAFRLEPISHLQFNCGPNSGYWQSIDSSCLRHVQSVELNLPPFDDRMGQRTLQTVDAVTAITHSENWISASSLSLTGPLLSIPPTWRNPYLDHVLGSPLLSRCRELHLWFGVSLRDIERIATSHKASHIESFNTYVDETGGVARVLANATFRPCLRSLQLARSGGQGEVDLGCLFDGRPWPRLKTLLLNWCGITDSSLRYLLPYVQQFESLWLMSNQITDAGAAHLADAVDPANPLQLCLSENPLSPNMVRRLQDRFGDRFIFHLGLFPRFLPAFDPT